MTGKHAAPPPCVADTQRDCHTRSAGSSAGLSARGEAQDVGSACLPSPPLFGGIGRCYAEPDIPSLPAPLSSPGRRVPAQPRGPDLQGLCGGQWRVPGGWPGGRPEGAACGNGGCQSPTLGSVARRHTANWPGRCHLQLFWYCKSTAGCGCPCGQVSLAAGCLVAARRSRPADACAARTHAGLLHHVALTRGDPTAPALPARCACCPRSKSSLTTPPTTRQRPPSTPPTARASPRRRSWASRASYRVRLHL